MIDLRGVVSAQMRALVDSFGCFDAVAETLNARWGPFGRGASKGTISKKMAGQLEWTVCDVLALEDAAGRYPVTRLLSRRMNARQVEAGTLLEAACGIAKECGEAQSAVLAAVQSCDAGEEAQAIKEIDEAIESLRAARTVLVERG